MPEIGTYGSMSGDGKRGDAAGPKLPRPSSTLPKLTFARLTWRRHVRDRRRVAKSRVTPRSKDKTWSRQLIEQRLCLLQVQRVEAFGEPAVDRGEEVAGFGAATLAISRKIVAGQP